MQRPHQRTNETGGDTPPPLQALHLAGLPGPILIPQAPGLLQALHHCLIDWPCRTVPLPPGAGTAPGSAPPLAIVEPRPGGRFRLYSRAVEGPMDGLDTATALCALIADLAQAWCEGLRGDAFGLHAGAVAMGGTGVILAGSWRAGKSTLVARLSMDPGVMVLADDVTPLTAAGRLTALGIAPRLRLPLPDGVGPTFRAHVERWLGPRDARYGYLRAPGLAPHGTECPARAFVLLDRQPKGGARLDRLHKDDLVQLILARSLSSPDGPEPTLAAAQALSARLEGVRLRYRCLEEAAELLCATFGQGGPVRARLLPRKALTQAVPPQPRQALVPPGLDAAALAPLCRSPDVVLRHVGARCFLWRPGAAMLYALNPTAQAVWALLAEPQSPQDVARALAAQHATVDPKVILEDVRALIGQMQDAGLVHPA